MHIFDYSFLDEGVLPAELVNLTSTISALNALSEERRTTDARIKEIVEGNSTPLNHTEMEIVGYRNALDEIHTSHSQMVISEQTILHLHQVMTEAAGYEGSGRYKADDNIIAEVDEYGRRRVRFSPVPASQTADAMEQLLLAYVDARDNARINNLLLIPCVILDFLCIHPFADGNGRVSRLLTLLLMYKSGFNIGKYVSFEEQINNSKEYYYSALQESSRGWHTNENTYIDFMKNFLSTLYKCYKELERIEQTVLNSVLPISKSEICEFLPDVSPTTVEAVLGKMVKEGSVKKLGSARATKYVNAKYIR